MRMIISTGGTGGHIFPAIAVAEAMMSRMPEADILFIGSKFRMEMQRVPDAGFKIVGLPVKGIDRAKPITALKAGLLLLKSMFLTWKEFKRFDPQVIIGFGAFASAPVMLSSRFWSAKKYIHEQNAYPGLVNKRVSHFMDRIFVAYEGMERYFPKSKISLVGNPIRTHKSSITQNIHEYLGFNDVSPIILVTGGSLGAKSLNDAMTQNFTAIAGNQNVQWVWQCGEKYLNDANRHPIASLDNVRVFGFLNNMSYIMQNVDLVCARAGALTLSELAFYGKPAVLIPSPNVAEDHQTSNAMALVNKNAAILVKDYNVGKEMIHKAISTVQDEKLMNELGQNIKSMAKLHAAENIVDFIIKNA